MRRGEKGEQAGGDVREEMGQEGRGWEKGVRRKGRKGEERGERLREFNSNEHLFFHPFAVVYSSTIRPFMILTTPGSYTYIHKMLLPPSFLCFLVYMPMGVVVYS